MHPYITGFRIILKKLCSENICTGDQLGTSDPAFKYCPLLSASQSRKTPFWWIESCGKESRSNTRTLWTSESWGVGFKQKNRPFKGVQIFIHAGSMLWFLLFWKEKKLAMVSLKMESFERCETMGVSLHQCCIKSMLCYWISAHLHTQHSSPPANQIDYTIIVQ